MNHSDPELHVRGLSRYIDDVPAPANTLFCAVRYSDKAAGHILKIDTAAAATIPGVVRIISAADIPGENQIGTIVMDEVLLASGEVHFIGQPVAAVYAESESAARRAAALIAVNIAAETAVVDSREAYARGMLLAPVRVFQRGDTEAAFKSCAHVVTGRTESGAQEHFYLEGQGALVIPLEGIGLRVISATQAPTLVQKITARVCGLPMHQVEVEVRRLGGAFGGKENQANAWAALAAIGTRLSGRPVKLVLRRSEDMCMTGKRHPYSSDYRIGLDATGRIRAYEVFFYQNAGATTDLSLAILERSLFHASGAYTIPNVKASAASCRTNLPPFTAFRGFGAPQAMFVLEAAIYRAALVSGIPHHHLQRINLLHEGDPFPYGMTAANCRAVACWEHSCKTYDIPAKIAAIKAADDPRYARGCACMPICFGISFTAIPLNQARALVHLYQDGSVGVSTGAVEMGQGVNRKIREICARTLGIPLQKIKIEATNTSRIANTSPTAASSGADLNGMAAQIACRQLYDRLIGFLVPNGYAAAGNLAIRDGRLWAEAGDAGDPVDLGVEWNTLIGAAHLARVHLSAEAHYATPDLRFDRTTETGRPFAYHVYGNAYTEVTVDRLLGTYTIDEVVVTHDLGRSLAPLVDEGQIAGGLAQGIGWLTVEEMRYASDGRALTATAGSYKVPDLGSCAYKLAINYLPDTGNPQAVLGSKAVGEPPFMYAIGVYFALLDAIGGHADMLEVIEAPMTPERTLEYLLKTNQHAAAHHFSDTQNRPAESPDASDL